MDNLEKMRDYIKNQDVDNIVKLVKENRSNKPFLNTSYDLLLLGKKWNDPKVFLNLTSNFKDNGLDTNFKPEGRDSSFFQRVIILIFTFYLEEGNYKRLLDPVLHEDIKKVVEENRSTYLNIILAFIDRSPKEVINNRADNGYTPFLTAVSLYKQKPYIRRELDFLASPSYVMIKIIKDLIEKGADLELPVLASRPNMRESGLSAIHIAAQKPATSKTLLKTLIEGTSINLNKFSDEGLTPLMYALTPIVDGVVRSEMAGDNIKFLLSKNADVNISASKFRNRNVLQMACIEPDIQLQVLKDIISGGGVQETILDHQDVDGYTALMLSIENTRTNPSEREKKIRELVFEGADIYLKNKAKEDVFVIMEQIRRKDLRLVTELMRHKQITDDQLKRLHAIRTNTLSLLVGIGDDDRDVEEELLQSMYDKTEKETGLSKETQITVGPVYESYIINTKINQLLNQKNVNIKEGTSFTKFDFDYDIPDDFTYNMEITDTLISGDTKSLMEWLYEPIRNVIFTDKNRENYAVLPKKDILKIIRAAEQVVVRCDKSKLSPGRLNITEDLVLMNYGIYLKTNALGMIGGPAEGTLINIKEIYSKIFDPTSYEDIVFVILRHDDHPLSPLASLASVNMGNGLNINNQQTDVTSSDHCQPETSGVKGSLQPMKVRPDAKAGVKKGGALHGKTVKYGVRKNRVVKLYPHKITKKIGRHNYYVLWKTTRKNLPGKTYHYKFFNTKEAAKDHISKRKKTRKRK